MDNKLKRYYVPDQSGWPILGAFSLLILAFGSLNLTEKLGFFVFLLGFIGLIFTLGGWLWSVTKESDAGLYNTRMDHTFRWGMFWFLISELFLFGLLLGSIFHARFSISPWLAGQSGDASFLTHYLLWPDFSKQWPLSSLPANSPNTSSFQPTHALRLIALSSVILFLLSLAFTFVSRFSLQKSQYIRSFFSLILSTFLGILIFILQIYYIFYLLNTDIIIKTGIYGSLLVGFVGLYLINIACILLFFSIICTRIYTKKINIKNVFSLDAALEWWTLLAFVWLIGFLLFF
jgi:cytochrome c oxidase subunit III